MAKRFIKKTSYVVVLVFLFSLFANSVGLAAAETITSMTPFNDVTTSFWGVKDIVKMQVRGVTSGYKDNTFQPNSPVTEMEAVLMAVKNMAVQNQLLAIDTSQPLPVSVPKWVETGNKREVLFAVQKGLIVPSEKNFNASAKATRAWIAQLVIRMVNKDDEASELAGQQTAIKDASDIPLWAVGYINAAYKYSLIAGYPDNSFKPNQNVTRAEMIAILSRGEEYLSLGETYITGKVLSVSGQNLSLAVNGVAKNYILSSGTWVFDNNGKFANTGIVKKDDAIKVIVSGNAVRYVEILPAEAVVTTLKGTVLQVIAQDGVIVIKDANQIIHTQTLMSSATISSQNGTINALAQITVGSQVELNLNSAGNVVSVVVQNAGAATGGQGIIYQINQAQKLIIVKDSTGKLNTYQYSDQVIVKISQIRFPAISDLQAGDEVKLTVSAGTVTQVEMVQPQLQVTLSGKVIMVSTEARIITMQTDNGVLEALPVSDSVQITITGTAAAQLSNILVNDSVDLTVEKGIVTAIKVNDRNAETVVAGTIAAVDTTNRIITIDTDNDGLKAYEVNTNAQFLINDSTTTSISSVKKDMKVELQIVNNKVIYLELKNTVKGTVASLDQNRRLITVDNGSASQAYVLDSLVDVDIDRDSSANLSDINNNDVVSIRIEDNVVTKINVQKTYSYEITNVYTSDNELGVREDDGDKRYLSLINSVTVIVPGIDHPDAGDFTAGDVIKVTYLGTRLDKVEATEVNRGKVTSVNNFNNTVTIQQFDGTNKVYNFTDKCEVVNGTQKNSQITALINGDRVEIREKTDGGMTFSVMTKVSSKFQSYTDDGNKVYVSKDPITWQYYVVSAKIYVHYGTASLALRNLAKDDQIDLYLLNDVVYEIEKK